LLLLVEDDPDLGQALGDALAPHFKHLWVRTLADARLALVAHPFELAIIDLGLPDGSGLDLVREMRQANSETLAIVLTANNRQEDKVQAIRNGADDYIAKPFDLEELLARCHAAIRRKRGTLNPVTTIGDLHYDKQAGRLVLGEQVVPLSATELRILDKLVARHGHVVSKRAIEEALYDWQGEVESNTVEVYISRLRRKLGKQYISTIRGLGYVLAAPK
jgi:two-component system, OmpR family, response regulator